jgi:hypothetical protein
VDDIQNLYARDEHEARKLILPPDWLGRSGTGGLQTPSLFPLGKMLLDWSQLRWAFQIAIARTPRPAAMDGR